jgi:hypothetical protein
MSGHYLTQSKYALQQVVEISGNLPIQLEEAHLTHTYEVVFRFRQLENIDYLVSRNLNTSALPFEEWAKEWLCDRKSSLHLHRRRVLETVRFWALLDK